MQSIVVIAVACALAIGREASSEPVSMCGLRCAMAIGCVVTVCMSARLIHLSLSGLESTARNKRLTEVLERTHLGFWVAVVGFLVFVVDWVTIVRTNWGWDGSVLVDDLLILMPLTIPWVISWAYFFDLPADPSGSSGRWQFVARQSRIAFGLGLLPVLVVCTVSDLAHRYCPEWAEGKMAAAIYILPMLGLLSLYPWLMRILWPTSRLPDGSLRTRLERLATENHIAIRDMYIWKTGNGALNAAVSGMIPGLRYVFLTDGLLADMTEDEIEAIYAHELGHVKHGHLSLRIIALLLPIFICIGFAESGPLLDTSAPAMARQVAFPDYLLLAATLGYMIFGLGWYARRLEHQADLWACQNLSSERPTNTDAVHGHAYYGVLQRLTKNDEQNSTGWLHPSPSDRLSFLDLATSSPPTAHRFHWQLRMLAVVLLAVTTWAIFSLIGSLTTLL
jgi:Zn-dependent protease with chaperone function